MIKLRLGHIVWINYSSVHRCSSMCDSLNERVSVLHFLSEDEEAREFSNLINYALRLDWLSYITLADACLLANMVVEQTVIAISKIVYIHE